MATSGTTAYTITGNEIIDLAMMDIGALAIGETPSDDEYTDARQRLNLLLKSLQTKFKFISTKEETTFSTVADTASYTLDAGIDEVREVWWEDSSGTIHPIDVHSDRAVIDIDNTATGVPTDAFIDETTSPFKMYFYPIPNDVYEIHYRKVSVLESVVSGTDEVDLPVKFVDMVVKGLAYRLSPSYRVPLDERMTLRGEFDTLVREALADNTYRSGEEIIVPLFIV